VIEFLQQAGWKVKTVLEVGCLTGYGMEILSRTGYEVSGIEVSRQAIQKRVNRNIIAASIEHLPFRDKAFNLVFSVAVLEHLNIAGVDLFLRELMRVGTYNYHSPAFQCGSKEGWHSTVRPLEFWLDRLKKLGTDLSHWHLEDITWAD
jgi:SAM-dependent methyltransferase